MNVVCFMYSNTAQQRVKALWNCGITCECLSVTMKFKAFVYVVQKQPVAPTIR